MKTVCLIGKPNTGKSSLFNSMIGENRSIIMDMPGITRDRIYGKVEFQYGRVSMNSPVFDEIENTNNTGKIIPIYPLTFSLTQNTLRKIIENGLEKVKEEGGLKETLPEYILKEYKLEDLF